MYKDGSTFGQVLLSNIDLTTLLGVVAVSNSYECKEFIYLAHKRVYDLLEMYADGNIVDVLKELTQLNENELLKERANKVIGFISWINEQIKMINLLNSQLEVKNKTQDDVMLENIIGDKFDKFGVKMLYKSIDPNPLKWHEIGEMSFNDIYTFQLMNKEHTEVMNDYNSYLNNKNKA